MNHWTTSMHLVSLRWRDLMWRWSTCCRARDPFPCAVFGSSFEAWWCWKDKKNIRVNDAWWWCYTCRGGLDWTVFCSLFFVPILDPLRMDVLSIWNLPFGKQTWPKNNITLLRVIPTMTFQNNHARFYVSLISGQVRVVRHDIYLPISWNASGYSQLRRLTVGHLLTFFLTFFLASLLTLFLTYLLTFFLTYLLTFFLTYFWHFFWHSFWHISWHSVWHSFWHIFWHSCWQISWHSFWHASWHIFWQSFWHSIWRLSGWGPSGREHWAQMVVVEVRPAGNTGLRSRLRSGREHWAQMVVVEAQQWRLNVAGRGWGPRWTWLLAVEVRQRTLDVAACGWGERRTGGGGGGREEEDDEEEEQEEPWLA